MYLFVFLPFLADPMTLKTNSRPPNGCLQYHTGLTGRITTFNFTPAASNHLNNQEYSTNNLKVFNNNI